MVGQTLGHYKILDKLGAGGMGEVYRAEDTTLKRQVALKVLPSELAASQERLERFQREAETLAALDHPNIVHIYTVEEAEGVRFLTMQLVEGKPLSGLIPKAGMPLERIFEIAIPLADALAAAHEKGVIHRDLKPGNIMVTAEGRVKVLDFGLAKLRQETEVPIATQLPTEPLTEEGRAVGTVPYMSPEQVEGKEVDHRSDLFSLGIILYEMATGQRPFQGDSPASVMSAILRDTPSSVTDLRDSSPRDLAKIIRRCLVKEPERRFQTARELAIELEELRSEVASGEAWETVPRPPRRGRAMLWAGLAAAGIVLVVGLAIVFWVFRSDDVPGAAGPTTGTFTKIVFDSANKGKVSTSPDGRFFVYASDASGNWDLYLRRLGGEKAINLTEDSPEDDIQPAFSPDGESIAFRSERDGGGIYVMGAMGESVRRVTDRGFFPDWAADGAKIVFSSAGHRGPWTTDTNERISTVDLSSGELGVVLDRSALMAVWSPNGWRIAYYGVWEPSEAGSQRDLFTVPADGGEPVYITEDVHIEDSPAWSPDGRHLYYVCDRSGTRDLWRVPIDEKTGKTLGIPQPMTSGSGVSHVSPSSDGNQILYSSRNEFREILKVPFDPVAETVVGPPVSITSPGLQAQYPSVSPDGEWIAFDAEFGHPGSFAIGVIRADGSALRQLTDSGHRDFYPHWSPDGQRLTFYSNRSGSQQAWIINADGGGLRQLIDAPGLEVSPPVWSPDGSRLAVSSLDEKTTYVFRADKPWSEEPPTQLPPFGDSEDRFWPMAWSPDAKLLAGLHWRGTPDATRIALYSFDSESYRIVTEELGLHVSSAWLNDGRRLMFSGQSVDGQSVDHRLIFLLDTESGDTRELLSSEGLSATPTVRAGRVASVAISPDNRSIYIHWYYTESDIWMLTLGDQESVLRPPPLPSHAEEVRVGGGVAFHAILFYTCNAPPPPKTKQIWGSWA